MRGVILDEYKILDDTFNGEIKNTKNSIQALVKYCIEQSYDKDETCAFINKTIKKHIKSFDLNKNKDYINELYSSTKKYNSKLIKVDTVSINVGEWENIISLNSPTLEKIAFIMLVYQKINEQINPSSNGWFNVDGSHMFREINNHKISFDDFVLTANQLVKNEYINQKNSNKSTSIHINFKSNGEVKFIITNFDKVITYYDEYRNDKKYIECIVCGKRVLNKGKKPNKYCNKCAKEIKLQMDKENVKKLRML